MIRKHAISFTLLVAVFFCIGSTHAEMTGIERGGWLLGVIFKLERMRDDAISDIQTYRMEISKSEETMRRARGLMSLARKKGNTRAEMIARDALTQAREAREKNKELLRLAQQRKKKTEFALASVRNLLAKQSSVKAEIRSVVTDYTGRVSILSKRLGETIPLEGGRTGFLEPGDTIITYADSSVEMQFLDGRGTLKLGEYSEVRLEEDSTGEQLIDMDKGKVYVAIDRIEDYRKMLMEGAKKLGDKYEKSLMNLNKVIEQKLAPRVRTQGSMGAVRGTKFVVIEDEEGTEYLVFEGVVEVKGVQEDHPVKVYAGYRVSVTKNGLISGPEKVDARRIIKWWEK